MQITLVNKVFSSTTMIGELDSNLDNDFKCIFPAHLVSENLYKSNLWKV